MSIVVTINGEDRTSSILAESRVSISKTYGEPWTCELGSFSLDGETQTITGDAEETQFELDRIPSNTPAVTVDGEPATVGIYGVDTGKDFYWELGTRNLYADSAPGVGVEVGVDLGTWYPSSGQTIEIENDGVKVFGGIIREVRREKVNSNSPLLKCGITATDYHHILERRVTGTFELAPTTDNAVLARLMTDVLTAEGLTTDTGTATAIDNFRTDNDTCANALASAASLTGKRLWIDPDKVIHLRAPADALAPFDVPESASNISSLVVTETDEDYANVIILRSSQTIAEEATEEFAGDGSATSFELTKPVAFAPTVTVNGTANTVGIASVDTGFDWYWSQGSREIRQDIGGVALTALDTLAVTYQGIESSVVTAENTTEIARRAAQEGSTGRYEKVFDSEALLTRSDAQATAEALLDERDDVALKAVYETSDYLEPEAKNLQPGQRQAILIDGWASKQSTYLVRSIQMTAMGTPASSDWQFRYTVEALYGSITKTVFQWFKSFGSGGSSTVGGAAGGGGVELKHFFAGTCAAVAAGTDIGKVRPMLYTPGSVVSVMSDCKTAPTSDLTFDILVSVDDGDTWNWVFTDVATHPSGVTGPVYWTTFMESANDLPQGAKFRLDVYTGGSAEGWLLQIAIA